MSYTTLSFLLRYNSLIATFKVEVANQVETNKIFGIKDKTVFCSCDELSVCELSKYPIQIESLCLAENVLEFFESVQSK